MKALKDKLWKMLSTAPHQQQAEETVAAVSGQTPQSHEAPLLFLQEAGLVW